MVLFVLLLKRVHFLVNETTHESCRRVHSNGTVCVFTEESSFSCERNLKASVITQMKALDEYIRVVTLFVLVKKVYSLHY